MAGNAVCSFPLRLPWLVRPGGRRPGRLPEGGGGGGPRMPKLTRMQASAMEAGWTIAILPDTQYYSKSYPYVFTSQTNWIVSQAQTLHIALVITLGDLVNKNLATQWQVASGALHLLDDNVPYVITTGQHDYTWHHWLEDDTLINDYFPTTVPPPLGRFLENHIENTYYLFSTPSTDWLVISIQWAPTDAVLGWADGVLKDYSTCPAIVVTHAYLYCDSTRYDHLNRPDQKENPHKHFASDADINDGEEIWQKLIKVNSNVRFVFSGHERCGPGFLVSNNDNGLPVYQMVANYQDLKARKNGGNGYLRLVEFLPDIHEVRVKTYSPWTHLYKTDVKNQFSFPYSF